MLNFALNGLIGGTIVPILRQYAVEGVNFAAEIFTFHSKATFFIDPYGGDSTEFAGF